MMSRRLLVLGFATLLPLGVCVVAWTPAVWAADMAGDLVVTVPAGTLARLADTAFVMPFAQATHLSAAVVALGATPPPLADVTLVDGQSLLAGCKSAAFRKLDWSAIGGRDRLLPQAATECGLGAVLRGLVLAWSRDKFSGAPTWADFWDVAKVPGKRGLRHGARGNLEFALMADGVGPGDVYSTLRDKAGVDRAFRKLDQLKPYIVWWSAEDEATRLLASGDVLMTSAPAGGVLAAAKATSGVAPRDFAVQWAGALLMFNSWVIPANAPHPDVAQHFLTFASDPKQQKGLAGFTGFGSAVTGGSDELGAAEKADSPTTQANLSAGLMADETFWQDNGEKLEKIYESWLVKP